MNTDCGKYLAGLNRSKNPIIARAIASGVNSDYLDVAKTLADIKHVDAAFLRSIAKIHLGKKKEALHEFESIVADPEANFLAPAFVDFLTGRQDEAAKMYGGAEFPLYFKAASESRFFQDMYRAVDNTVQSFPPDGDIFRIIDIGIGTGTQIERIIKWIPQKWPHIKKVHVIGIEPYENVYTIAKSKLEALAKDTTLQVTIDIVRKFAQDLGPRSLAQVVSDGAPIHVVNACASIHHMPKGQKQDLLKAIHAWNPKLFIITDADSEHDSTLPDLSFELIANVSSFYSTLLEYMFLENPNPQRAHYLRGFTFFDARNILFETGPRRIEFHTPANKWNTYLAEAGFVTLTPRPEWVEGLNPGHHECKFDHILTGIFKRPLSFQITATAMPEACR